MNELGQLITPQGQQGAGAVQQGAPTPPDEASVQGWDNFLDRLSTDSNLQMSLIQGGLQMMTPKAAGENHASKILQGINTGLEGYQGRENNALKQEEARAGIASTQAGTEGQVIDNTVSDATSQYTIDNAASIADLNASKAVAAGVTATNEPERQRLELENADLAGSQAQANISKVYKSIEHMEAQMSELRSGRGGAKDKRGADQVMAEALATARVGSREENPEAWNEEFSAIALKLTTESPTKNPALLRAELAAEMGLMMLPEDSNHRIRGEAALDELIGSYTQSLATDSAPQKLSPELQAQKDEAITQLVRNGMTVVEATAVVERKQQQLLQQGQ